MSSYYDQKDLEFFPKMGENSPELWNKYMEYYASVFKDNLLTHKEKALIALGVAHALHCPYCIESYTVSLLEMGLTFDHLIEAIHVASSISSGAVLAHGMQSKNVVNKLNFSENDKDMNTDEK